MTKILRVLLALEAGLLLPVMLGRLQTPCARLDRPLVTQTLEDVDKWLGFDWLAYSTALKGCWLSAPTEAAYLAYTPLMLSALVALSVLDWPRAVRFYMAVTFSLLFTLLLFALFPADNAAGAHAILVPWSIDLFAARAGVGSGPEIVSFPSMHVAGGIVLVWAGWPTRVRWPLLLLQLLAFSGVPVWGEHFLVDCLAGAAVGLVSVILVRRTSCKFLFSGLRRYRTSAAATRRSSGS